MTTANRPPAAVAVTTIEREEDRAMNTERIDVIRRRLGSAMLVAKWLAPLLLLAAFAVQAQGRLDKAGVTLYWGVVPQAVAAKQHSTEDLHGGVPKGGGQGHHLVVALFDTASGRRIEDAVVRAQVSEVGIQDEPPKALTPMRVNDLASYGQVFWVAKEGPYRFKVWVRLAGRQDEIEFTFSAPSPHRTDR